MPKKVLSYIAIILIASVVTFITSNIQTGSRPLNAGTNAVEKDGTPCQFKQFGFPLKAQTAVYEPCSYYVNESNKPFGFGLIYSYVNVFAVIANLVFWSGALLLVSKLTKGTLLALKRDSHDK